MITGLAAFELVARINRVDANIDLMAREFAVDGEIAPAQLLRVARRCGFKARVKQLPLAQLAAAYPLPAIVRLRQGAYQVLLKVTSDKGKVLLFDPAQRASLEAEAAAFEAGVDRYVVLRHRDAVSQAAFGLRWFWSEMLTFKRIMAEVLIGSFAVQLFGLVTPLFTQVILDKVIVHRSLSTLNVIGVAFVAVVLFEMLLNMARQYIFIHTAAKLDARLGAKLFRHLFSLPFAYFEARKVGTIAARVRELDTIREFVTHRAVGTIIDLIFSSVFIAVMLLYSVPLTLVVLAFVAVVAAIFVAVTPELRRRLEAKFQMAAAANSYLVESVGGIQTVKSLAVEGAMQRRWEDNLARYVAAGFNLGTMSGIAGALTTTCQRLMTLAILYMGVSAVIGSRLTIGQLIAFQMFAGQLAGPVLRLVNLWNEFQQALLSVDRLGDILNQPTEVGTQKPLTLSRLKGALRIEAVSFCYSPGGPKVLDRFGVDLAPGTSVGIVGRSGSGKSTLTKLIQRLYIPTEGAIFIDGIDLRHLNPFWLRMNIGVVLQENVLFSGTIRENIALARPQASMEMVLQASRLAGADEFIAQLPLGYETEVGERGASLSGGQRQRIAIARALITDPRLLIFDEATSALDVESEQVIRDNLKAIRRNRTTLIVSHRLHFVADCDLILVMDKGQLLESGSHGELMTKGGYYHQLYRRQHRGADAL